MWSQYGVSFSPFAPRKWPEALDPISIGQDLNLIICLVLFKGYNVRRDLAVYSINAGTIMLAEEKSH